MSLKLRGLEFRQGAFALKADVEAGARVTGLFGASGAGKTTLLELIAGLRKPTRGEIELAGARIEKLPPEQRQIGYVPQDLALFPHLTVEENLRFAPNSGATDFEHVVTALSIKPLLGRKPYQISGGEKQRVALGRALMRQPRLLLLDEPLSSLDAPLKESLLGLVKGIAEEFNTPALYVTHDPAELAAISDEVIVLEQGRITKRGKFDTIFEAIDEPRYRLAG